MTKKRLFLVLLALIMTLLLAACGDTPECTEHKDTDSDGKCDVCSATVEVEKPDSDTLVLIEDGEAKFQFVTSADAPGSVINAVDKFIIELKNLGITVKRVDDVESTAQSCEILVGDVKSRGDKYDLNDKKYGMKGYAVELIEGKVVVI